MAKELEQCIPIYLFSLSISFNQGIESLKTMKEKYGKIYQNKNDETAAPIP